MTLVVMGVTVLSAQEKKPMYAPLDSVPAWVKEKVTPEEYEMWKALSGVFRIDYSFLKRDLTPQQKELLYREVEGICAKIKKGELEQCVGDCLTLTSVSDFDRLAYKGEPVPAWVKEKVTPEEYENLETLSVVYKVDYGFLREKSFYEPERRAGIAAFIAKKADEVRKGNCEDKRGTGIGFSVPAEVDTTLIWKGTTIPQKDGSLRHCMRKAVVYTGGHSDEAQVQLMVWYLYDTAKREVSDIRYKLVPMNASDKFYGGASIGFQKNGNRLQGEFSGSLCYKDKWQRKRWDTIRKGFVIPLE